MPSLQEIEKAMSILWMDQEARDWLLSDNDEKTAPALVLSFDPSIIAQLDRKGASVYARSITYEHHSMADRIFPFCAKALGNAWDQLVVDYYKIYPSSHFDFNKICLNFSRYLKEARQDDVLEKFPYLAELAEYEWLELEKLEDPHDIIRAENVQIDGLEKINSYAPVLNPTLSLCKFSYPIGDIASYLEKSKRPRKKFAAKNCRMVIYRDPETNNARFVELGEASAAIVEMAKTDASYMDLLKLTLSLTTESDPAGITVEFLSLIEELQKDNIFIGSIKKGK